MLAGGAVGCMSETLVDNYDAVPDGDYSSFVPPTMVSSGTKVSYGASESGVVLNQGLPQFITARGGAGSSTVANAAGNAGISVGVNGQGAVVRHSPRIARHYLRRYALLEQRASSRTELEFGVTANDHVVAMVSESRTQLTGESTGEDRRLPGLFEVLPGGQSLRYAIFTNGRIPDAFFVEPNGAVVMAGRLDQDVSYGGPTINKMDFGYYVVKLDADWKPVFGIGVAAATDQIPSQILVDSQGTTHVALVSKDPTGLGNSVALAGFDAQGRQSYQRDVASGQGLTLRGIAGGAEPLIFLAGSVDGMGSFGSQVLSDPDKSIRWFGAWDVTTGRTQKAQSFGCTGLSRGLGIVLGSEGRVRFAADASGNATLFGVEMNATPQGTPIVVELSRDGTPTWISILGDAGMVSDMAQLGQRSFIAGYLFGASASNPYLNSKLFAAELDADGQVLSHWEIRSNGSNPVRIGVDSIGTIWLSGRVLLSPDAGFDGYETDAILELPRLLAD